MDKNIAAILRDDTRTCMVAFQSTKDLSGWNTATTYMYVTTIPLSRGDIVVVPAREHMTVGTITEVHDELCIDPGSEHEFKFVVAVVDTAHHTSDMTRNREIEETLRQEHKARMRAQFKEQFLTADQNLVRVLGSYA